MSSAHTRRRRLLAAAILVAMGLAGLWAYSLVPPTGELVAGMLSSWMERPVAVRRVELRLRSGIELELEGVRVDSDPAQGPGAPPLLEIERARGRQSWPRLLAGQLVPLSWELSAPVLRLQPGSARGGEVSVPDLDLMISDGRVEWLREGEAPLVARDVSVQARRGALGTQTRGRAAAALYAGDTLVCSLDVDFDGWLDGGTVRGALQDLDLAQLPQKALPLRGRASGRFALSRTPDSAELELQADVTRLDVTPPGMHGALRPRETRVETRARWRGGTLELELQRLRLDDIDARGSISVEPRSGGRTRGELVLAPFQPGPSERLHPVHVLAGFARSWVDRNERIAAGRVLDAVLRWDVPIAELGATLGFQRRPAENELEIRLEVEGGTYRAFDTGKPLEDISGALEIRGDSLHVTRLKIRQGETWLPELDIRIDGMTRFAHLPPDERYVSTGPEVPLPGLGPLFRELSQGADGEGAEAPPIRLRNVDLYYPPALLPVRDGRGRLTRRGTGIEVALERAVIGGVPAQADVHWDGGERKLAIDLRYEQSDVPPRAPAPHWLAASFEVDQVSIAGWQFRDVGGRLSVVRDRAELGAVHGRLAGGPFTARGEISLAQEARAPYWLEFEASEADASELAPYVDLTPENVTGRLAGSGRLEGALDPGESFLDSAGLDSRVEMREGHLGGLPVLIAIARLPSLRGAPGALLGRPLEYRSASGNATIADGVLTLTEVKVDGPELRMLVDGQMQLREAGRPRDLLVTLLFLRTVDDLIAQVPFLGTFVLGKDESLVGASFRVQGPHDDTRVTPLPPETLSNATQWATGVLSSGARRLGRLIRILPPAKPKESRDAEDGAADTRTKEDPGPP